MTFNFNFWGVSNFRPPFRTDSCQLFFTMRRRNWCFTVNNPEADLSWNDFTEAGATYLVFQEERGERGTTHYQGYVEFSAGKTMARVKRIPGMKRAHLEPRQGTAKQAADYCKKADTRFDGPWEFGAITSQGKRSDLENFISRAKELDGAMSEQEQIEEFTSISARYPKFQLRVLQHYLPGS